MEEEKIIKWENIVKGWVLSLIGLAIIIGVLCHWAGFYEFPNPEVLAKGWEICIGLLIGVILLISPKTKLEEIINKVLDLVFSFFKKKVDGNVDGKI